MITTEGIQAAANLAGYVTVSLHDHATIPRLCVFVRCLASLPLSKDWRRLIIPAGHVDELTCNFSVGR